MGIYIGLLNISICYAAEFIPEKNDKSGYVEPFQMFDNVFYVGDKWASSYLIQTKEGLVLIDTLESPYGRWIPENIKELGLNPADIKYIMVGHGHSDHVGNAEYLQWRYGSQVLMSKKEFLLAKRQAKKSKGKGAFKAPIVNDFVEDGDKLTVGETTFNFYITPGHTDACLSVDFNVKHKGKIYRAFMFGGHSPPKDDVGNINLFLESIDKIRVLASTRPAVSVNLANHPQKNKLFEKHSLGKVNQAVNYFIDGQGFLGFLDEQEAKGLKALFELQQKD